MPVYDQNALYKQGVFWSMLRLRMNLNWEAKDVHDWLTDGF